MFSILNRALPWAISSYGNKFCLRKRSRWIKGLDNRFYVKFMELEIGLLCHQNAAIIPQNLVFKQKSRKLNKGLLVVILTLSISFLKESNCQQLDWVTREKSIEISLLKLTLS